MLKNSYYEEFGVKMAAENRKRILEIEAAHKKANELFMSFKKDFPLPDGRTWNIYGNDILAETF
jgi:hypothetical protein